HGTLPEAVTMGAVGVAALIANGVSFGLLWAYRSADANMRSAWICRRTDVLGNLAVLLAALGVFGTGTGWPDIIVAAIMASLALQGATIVVRRNCASRLFCQPSKYWRGNVRCWHSGAQSIPSGKVRLLGYCGIEKTREPERLHRGFNTYHSRHGGIVV